MKFQFTVYSIGDFINLMLPTIVFVLAIDAGSPETAFFTLVSGLIA